MRGDTDFEGLVHRHHAALYRFAFTLCGNESDAADLVQETFLLWATKGHQLKDSVKVKSWLFTTLYRAFIGRRRRLIRFPHQELSDAEIDALELPATAPARVDWKAATDCLARLDETFRAPVALFYLEDCSYNEIASTLEVPLGTVKSRISRGIAMLQRMMAEPAQDTARKANA